MEVRYEKWGAGVPPVSHWCEKCYITKFSYSIFQDTIWTLKKF